MLKDYLKLFRVKRTLLNAPPMIVGYFLATNFVFTVENILYFLAIFISFSVFFYTGIYAINDIIDYPLDKRNPDKKVRSITSGRVSINKGLIFGIIFLFLGFFSAFFIKKELLYLEFIYLEMNLLYSFVFKKIPYIEIVANAIFHPGRFIMGSIILGSQIYWLPAISFFFLVISTCATKREEEIFKKQKAFRLALKSYTRYSFYILHFINFLVVSAMCFISHGTSQILCLAVFFIFIILIFPYSLSDKFKGKVSSGSI